MLADLSRSLLVDMGLGDYSETRADFWEAVYSAVYGALGSNNLTGFKSAMQRAINTAYLDAADTAWIDAGNRLPLEDDEVEAYNAYLSQQQGAVDSLALSVKQFASNGDNKDGDLHAFAMARADGYARSLDGLYGRIKVMGSGNKMLTFDGEDGHTKGFPCKQCDKLKGQRHRASWWVSKGLVPYQGNDNFDCGCWECKHFLRDDVGKVFTL